MSIILIANIYDERSNSLSYLYLKNNCFYGYMIKNKYKTSIKKEVLLFLLSKIKKNNNCIYLYSDNDYDIYYDRENNLKHYLKKGKEDFKLFFLNNGEDALLYSGTYSFKDKRKNRRNKLAKTFLIDGLIITLSISAITFINNTKYEEILSYKIENIIDYDANLLFDNYTVLDKITVKECLELINKSPFLTEKEKTYFSNEKFLNFIFPYYGNSNMRYILRNRLDNLQIDYFKSFGHTLGYYSSLIHDTLNIANKINFEDNNEVFSHEYIHLFQTNSKYHFIIETVDELLNQEFYEINNYAIYFRDVTTLKLLIQTIGSDALLKISFASDDSELREILSTNLESKDYQKILILLKNKPQTINNNESNELRNIISKLYFNIYHKNMYDDPGIIYELLYEAQRNYNEKSRIFYFNNDRIKDNYLVDVDLSLVEANGFVTKNGKLDTYQRIISRDEYLSLINNNSSSAKYNNIGVFSFSKLADSSIIDNYIPYLNWEEANKYNEIYIEWIYPAYQNRDNYPIHVIEANYDCVFSGYVMGEKYYFSVPNYQLKMENETSYKTKIKK